MKTYKTSLQKDIYDLYIRGVQNPEEVAEFTNSLYWKKKNKFPQTLREDFCGTAINCLKWMKKISKGSAIGVDINPEPLKWAEKNLPFKSLKNKEKFQLIEGDALKVETEPCDVLLSLNSSVFYFHKREQLLNYLNACYDRITKNGLLILEVYGGPDAYSTGNDKIKFKDFTLIWEQSSFNSLTNRSINHIHFEFPDGSRIDRAFSYDFRLWSIAELMDLIKETPFHKPEIYPIGDDSYTKLPKTIKPVKDMEIKNSFTTYIVCQPKT